MKSSRWDLFSLVLKYRSMFNIHLVTTFFFNLAKFPGTLEARLMGFH